MKHPHVIRHMNKLQEQPFACPRRIVETLVHLDFLEQTSQVVSKSRSNCHTPLKMEINAEPSYYCT